MSPGNNHKRHDRHGTNLSTPQSSVVVHEDCDPDSYDHDVGLVRLADDVDFDSHFAKIEPACLCQSPPKRGASVRQQKKIFFKNLSQRRRSIL